jgi:hypothetical protein
MDDVTRRRALELIDDLTVDLTAKVKGGGLEGFHPSPTQLKWILAPAKEKALVGANKSGKSATMIWLLCVHMTGKYPETITETIWDAGQQKFVLGESYKFPEEAKIRPKEMKDRRIVVRFNVSDLKKVKINVRPLMDKYLDGEIEYCESGPDKYITEAHLPNGVVIYFTSNRQKADAHEGGEFDIYCSDEPPVLAYYIASLRGLIKKEAIALLAMTPLHAAWINRVFVDPPAEIVKMRQELGEWAVPYAIRLPFSENPAYTPDEKKNWELGLSNVSEEERMARLEGESYQLIGAVFGQEYEEKKGDLPWHKTPLKPLDPDRWVLYHGLDPHDRRGPAQVWIAVGVPYNGFSPKVVIYEDYRSMRNRSIANNILFCREVERERMQGIFGKPMRVLFRYIDPRFGNTQSSEVGSKHKDYYKEISCQPQFDYPMAFLDGNGSLETRHSIIRDMLKNVHEWEDDDGKIVLMPELSGADSCRAWHDAMRNYSYDPDRAGVTEDYKDLPDASGLVLARNPLYYRLEEEGKSTRGLLDSFCEVVSPEEDFI